MAISEQLIQHYYTVIILVNAPPFEKAAPLQNVQERRALLFLFPVRMADENVPGVYSKMPPNLQNNGWAKQRSK